MVCFDVFCVSGSGLGVFSLHSVVPITPLSAAADLGNQAALLLHMTRCWSCWAGFGAVPEFSSRSSPMAQCRAMVWLMGPSTCGSRLSFFYVLPFLPCRSPPAQSRGRSGYYGYSDCGTRLYYFILNHFRWYNFASPPLAEVVALVRFFDFPSTDSG